jgi:hypothetical protein
MVQDLEHVFGVCESQRISSRSQHALLHGDPAQSSGWSLPSRPMTLELVGAVVRGHLGDPVAGAGELRERVLNLLRRRQPAAAPGVSLLLVDR